MKIKKLEIKNYRSLCDFLVYPKDILAIVGQNNSGKSNILKALQLFFEASTSLVDNECFYNMKIENPIKIFITFDNLSNWEKTQFNGWLNDKGELIIGREIICTSEDCYVINSIGVKVVPEPEWLQEDCISGDKINEWWVNKSSLVINGLDFGVTLGSTKPKVGQWKEAALEFINNNRASIPFVTLEIPNPKGYSGVLKGALPEFIYVPAVRDVTDEAKVNKTNPFGQLINSIFDKIAEEKKNEIKNKLNEIERLLNRSESGERLAEITEFETTLNKLIKDIMECDVEIEMNTPKLKEVFSGAKLFANDGVRTAIETKGHGLQRSMIFTIFRAYATIANMKKAGESYKERSTIFAVEEPELYLHPQAQRTLMSVFREIASGNDQIIYTTHSSTFVDIAYFDEVCIMRKENTDGIDKSIPKQFSVNELIVDLEKRKGVKASEESIRELYQHVFNTMINEGFFADKIIIVEGESEQYVLPIIADAIGFNFDQNNISVINSGGKGSIDRLMRIFNGFEIPIYVIFDGDKGNSDQSVKEKTLELLELLGEKKDSIDKVVTEIKDNFAVFEFFLETTLKNEIRDYEKLVSEARKKMGPIGKPLTNKYIAQKISKVISEGKKIEEVAPNSILSIIEKVKKVKFSGSILVK